MSTLKSIICLANSRKLRGRCFAGKEIVGDEIIGWIRPVSNSGSGELFPRHFLCQDNHIPSHLDVIKVSLGSHFPSSCQSENWLIDQEYNWELEGKFPIARLDELIDDVDSLWINGIHGSYGYNDRISIEEANELVTTSLLLVKPEHLALTINPEYGGRRKVRANFGYQGSDYRISCTDIYVENILRREDDGEYPQNCEDLFLCVSLGEPFGEYVYKLVASVINFKK